ncbi:MAG: lysylphosphatidylglycerol synthase transmembrane domain-containing protein [Phototrophicales bacterium]
MTKRQQIAVSIGVLISLIFLWVAFRNLHPEQVLGELERVNPAWLILGAGWYFMAVLVITLRWQYLLNAITNIPLKALYPLVCIGYMGNNIYPFRSGEALRIFLLWRNHDVPFIKGTTTVLVERVFDGIVMLSFIIIGLIFSDVASDEIRQVLIVAAPIFLLASMTFFVLSTKPQWLRALVQFFNRFLPHHLHDIVEKISEDVLHGLEGLRTPTQLVGTVISSYMTWMLEASVYWMVAWAFSLEASYALMLLVVGTVNLAGLIPASPGQLGVFEFFVSTVLLAAGVAEATALGYALTVHIVIWLPVTLAGVFFLLQQGLGWNAIAHAHDKIENTDREMTHDH